MTPRVIVCDGLDGGDPLTMLASLGLLVIGERAGCIDRMWWKWDGAWRAVYRSSFNEEVLVDAVIHFLVGRDASVARAELESSDKALADLENQLLVARAAVNAAASRGARLQAKTPYDALVARQKELRARRSERAACVEELASRGVAERHAVTGLAQHLDDATKGGLSRAQLRSLARDATAAPYLSGLACDLNLPGKKPVIARTHLSFANNNSGKQLLKDFAALARLATEMRVRDALFGAGLVRDAITGLGWDPASQRSYALQFRNPQNEVTCQAMHHALAFVGLACLTVVPLGEERATLGVVQFGVEADAEDPDGGDEEGQAKRRRPKRGAEYLTWPIWSEPLSPDAVRSLLAWRELSEVRPSTDVCRAFGLEAVIRSRRFALNKRSYLSPSRPVA